MHNWSELWCVVHWRIPFVVSVMFRRRSAASVIPVCPRGSAIMMRAIVFGWADGPRTGTNRLVDRLNQGDLLVDQNSWFRQLGCASVFGCSEADVGDSLAAFIQRQSDVEVSVLLEFVVERLFDMLVVCLRVQSADTKHLVRVRNRRVLLPGWRPITGTRRSSMSAAHSFRRNSLIGASIVAARRGATFNPS